MEILIRHGHKVTIAIDTGGQRQLVSAGVTIAQWSAVYVMSRHEKRISQHLDAQEIDHFLPVYEAQRRWKNGSRRIIQFPLFPNYLFVRMTSKQRVSVLGVPGVLWIVGSGGKPSVVPDSDVELLREKIAQDKIEPHPYLVAGEWVRVRSGPLVGMEGILVKKKGGFRVVVTFELIKRSMAVELDIADLELCKSKQNQFAS